MKTKNLASKLKSLFFTVVLAVLATPISAQEAKDFTLFDDQGQAVQLHYHRLADAIVLLTHRLDSDLVVDAVANIDEVRALHPELTIPFFLINSQKDVSRQALQQDRQSHGYDAPILQDDAQLVGNTFDLGTAGEVLLIDPSTWEIVYRGPVNESAGAEQGDYLLQAMQALLTGEGRRELVSPRAMPERFAQESVDVNIEWDNVSYVDDVVPILQEKCVSCHRPEGIGPWGMTSHAMVQGFSPMIREVLLTKRMPPWHADPKINTFKHDMGLSAEQAQKLVSWIDAGAVNNDVNDPLTLVAQRATDWELGTPDLVLELPAFTVPATGTLDYQILTVDNPLDRDIWVRAVQIVPSDRQVLHHAIATFGPKDFDSGIDLGSPIGEALFQSQLMTFVPGNELYEYPQGTGVLVPAGSTFFSQMHYTTYGRETTDHTKIGLYFSETEPEFTLQHYAMVNAELRIPAQDPSYTAGAYYEFQNDAIIYSLFPHAHYRGRSSSFAVISPDGQEETLLSVPHYDFNWQRYFQLEQPKFVAAGTKLIHRTVYDNSAQNLSNPDSTKVVRFGEQTWEEMLYGGVSFRFANKEDDVQGVDTGKYVTGITMGYMDLNMDGKVELDEMPERARQGLVMAFVLLDKDKSGGLEFDEFALLMTQMTRREQEQ